MLFSALFKGVSKVIGLLNDLLPDFNLSNTNLVKAIEFLQPKWEIANKIFPLNELIVVVGILIAWSIAMAIFWAAQRVINLIRGSG